VVGLANPVLTKINYSNWALLMKVKLKTRVLWSVVEKGGADVEEDMMTVDTLCSAVPLEMVHLVVKMETVKEAWDTIATI
jgi:hypothetical protein